MFSFESLLRFTFLIISSGIVCLSADVANAQGRRASPPSDPEQSLTWSVTHLAQTLYPGSETKISESFRSNRKIERLDFWISPHMNAFISVYPPRFDSIVPNRDYPVIVTFTAPDMAKGAYLEGFLKTFAKKS